MIEVKDMVSVAEAAKRLNRSTEQVRRNLRDGKLKGQRIGNQWFVEESCLVSEKLEPKPLIPPALIVKVTRLRRQIAQENPGYTFDVEEMLRRSREGR
jgi:excisionase family DNA binding protein